MPRVKNCSHCGKCTACVGRDGRIVGCGKIGNFHTAEAAVIFVFVEKRDHGKKFVQIIGRGKRRDLRANKVGNLALTQKSTHELVTIHASFVVFRAVNGVE